MPLWQENQTGDAVMETNDWINSLERAVEICRDQISLARAVNVDKIAVPVESLEKILNAIPASLLPGEENRGEMTAAGNSNE
jgi:hypothetical protein